MKEARPAWVDRVPIEWEPRPLGESAAPEGGVPPVLAALRVIWPLIEQMARGSRAGAGVRNAARTRRPDQRGAEIIER